MKNTERAEWLKETVLMVHEQGYRVTPVFASGKCLPYADGQTYIEGKHYKGAIAVAVVLDEAVLLDYDGNKSDDSDQSILSLDALAALLKHDDMPSPVQEGSSGRSLHFLYRRDCDVSQASRDGWKPHIDLKTGNQLMILKPHKIITDGELPRKEDLPACPEPIINALNKRDEGGVRLTSVPPAEKVDDAIEDIRSGRNLHTSALVIINSMIFAGRSRKEIEEKFESLRDDIAQRGIERCKTFWGGELKDLIDSGIKRYGSSAIDDFDTIKIDGENDPWSEWVFVSHDNLFRRISTGAEVGIGAFNLRMAGMDTWVEGKSGKMKRYKPADFMQEHLRRPSVYAAIYAPHAGRFFEYDGEKCVNSYQPDRIPKEDANWAVNDAWRIVECHIMDMFPTKEEGRLLIQWMAHNVQRPGKKILWAPIICGLPGDGKSTIRNILGYAMGAQNVKDVSTNEIFSAFNSYAEGAAVAALEEIRVKGHNRHEVMNQLKPLLTNPVVSVVKKGRDAIQVPNATNYIAFTNHQDAIVLDEHDRRWGVFFTKYKTRSELLQARDDAYWERLHAAYRENPAVIRGWLLSVSLDGFLSNRCPEMNVAKLRMIEASESDEEYTLREVTEELGPVLRTRLVSGECKTRNLKLSDKRIGDYLAKRGYEVLHIKKDGKTVRFWYDPKVADEMGLKAGSSELREWIKRVDAAMGEECPF